MSNNEKIVEVYQARGEMEAQVIKGLLESYGVPCFLKSTAAPSVHTFTVNGMGEVKVMVRASMAEKAKKLVREKDHV